jgi:hypothetical protein
MEKINKNVWTTTVEDTNDGSGDVIVPLPQEMLDSLGWKEGDTVNIEKKDGVIYVDKPKC